MKLIKYFALIIILFPAISCTSTNGKVEFEHDEDDKKVDISINGNYFTSFIYPDDMEKQVLYPISTAAGNEITRGFPIDPKPFERTDHPHHVGLWFNFGDVNGLDFWNNSFAIEADRKHNYGSIKFNEIVELNQKEGKLVAKSTWVNIDNETLLNEVTTYIFDENNGTRSIERITELTAEQEVTFKDNKEGLIGLRVDRAFEEPVDKPGRFLDANGNVTETPVLNNEGVNGVYRNAEGVTGGDVWGKRSPWVALKAEKNDEVITIVILDHPENPNYPAWSHARGYGLFATNNLAGRAVEDDTEPAIVELSPGENVVFKHKVIIGGDLADNQITEIANNFHKK
ncbi:MAG: PmoA family protein [Bacteroidota bacterium]